MSSGSRLESLRMYDEEKLLKGKAARLFLAAQKLAERTPQFFETKGPSKGDHATNEFMEKLRQIVKGLFGEDHSEKAACKSANYRFDFYFSDEATVVEFAFSLDKPISEFERDIFKCLLAQKEGTKISRLVFICKPGGLARQRFPGPKAIIDFVREHYGIDIQIEELVRSPE